MNISYNVCLCFLFLKGSSWRFVYSLFDNHLTASYNIVSFLQIVAHQVCWCVMVKCFIQFTDWSSTYLTRPQILTGCLLNVKPVAKSGLVRCDFRGSEMSTQYSYFSAKTNAIIFMIFLHSHTICQELKLRKHVLNKPHIHTYIQLF